MDWIDVKKQTPNLTNSHSGRLLGCDSDGHVYESNWFGNKFYVFLNGNWVIDKDLVYWSEYPKPPKHLI